MIRACVRYCPDFVACGIFLLSVIEEGKIVRLAQYFNISSGDKEVHNICSERKQVEPDTP